MKARRFAGVLALAAALAAAAGCAMHAAPDRVHPVDAAEAARLLESRKNAFLLDVSPPDDFAAGHIAGALDIPRSQLWFRMYDVPADQSTTILVYDVHGERSLDAAKQLLDEGYYRVYSMRGGLDAWRAAGLPVAR